MKSKSILKFLVSLFLLGFLVACSGESKESRQPEPIPVTSNTSEAYIHINDSSNVNQATLFLGETFELRTADQTLFGELTKADKRKYYDSNGNLHYSVKYKTDGFKLRDANEQLLWKVKVNNGRIKIANDEAMQNAYKIKQSESGKIKISHQEKEIKTVRPSHNGPILQLSQNQNIVGLAHEDLGGILLLDALQPMEQYVILMELTKLQP
ncbi:MAG: hypothetical protein ACFB10_14125 [Salibacteraceae bacterium]